MLANVAHSPAWRSHGYVCLACRRQRLLSNRRHQRRFNSELAHTTTPADSWFEGLNDISDEYASKPKKSTRTKESKSAAPPSRDVRQKRESGDGRHRGGIASLGSKLDEEIYGGIEETSVKTFKPFTFDGSVSETSQTSRAGSDVLSGRQKGRGEDSLESLRQRLMLSGEERKKVESLETEKAPAIDTKARLIDMLRQEAKHIQTQQDAKLDKRETGNAVSNDSVEELDYKPFGSFSSAQPTEEANAATTQASGHQPRIVMSRNLRKSEKILDDTATDHVEPSQTVETTSTPMSEPISLVDRYLMNKERKTPWGVSEVATARVRRSAAHLEKSTPLKSAFAFKLAKDRGPASSENGKLALEHSESIGKILEDMKKRAGPDHAITEVDVASQEGVVQEPSKAEESTELEAEQRGKPDLTLETLSNPTTSNEESVSQTLTEVAEALSESQTEQVEQFSPSDDSSTNLPSSEPEPALQASSQTPEEATKRDPKHAKKPDQAHKRLFSLYRRRPPVATAEETIQLETVATQETRPHELAKLEKNEGGLLRGTPQIRYFHSTVANASKEDQPDEREETPSNVDIMSMEPSSLEVKPLEIPQPPVPFLEYDLDRVLFNPGVYQLQDPASRVYNFDPYLQKIMPVVDFDFDALKEYKTSSEDQALAKLAKEQDKKYIGSTSSMTSSLAHFHYLLSNWRPLNLSMLTDGYVGKGTADNFTEINRAPSAIFLRWKDGTYAIDADKEYDGANVLMLLGKSMELLLTMPTDEYERYRKSDPRRVPESQKTAPESYQYTTMRDFLMRSQLDAYDPRLPGNGMFDLKTRAVVSVRMQSQEFEQMTGYEIQTLHGKWGSYEREYHDMMRSTMLKYMLQARMGRMNGIFVAYHNVKRIFGFQYIPMADMDRALHGQTDPCLGDQEFKASLEIMNELFNKATAKFPGQSLRFHFETDQRRGNDGMPTAMHVFAEPMSEEEIDRIQNSQKAKIQEFERDIMGKNGESCQPSSSQKSAKTNKAETSSDKTLSSTNSDADTSFLGSISSTKPDDNLKPLFYATVIAQSKVNDNPVPNDRPRDLKPDEKWEIDYIIKDYEITRHEWAFYEDCRSRRKFALSERDDEDGMDPESEGKPKQENAFIKYLKDMAAEGRAWREKVDKMDEGKEVVRLDKGLPRERERIEGVEDYMRWMYAGK